MSTLRSQLDSLAHQFASSVLEAIRSASIEELLDGRRLRGGGGELPVPVRKHDGRLPRRSSDDIARTLDRVVSVVKKNKEGMRAEEIRKALGLDVREMPRVLKEGLTKKKLRSKGQKRATTYFAR